MRQLSRTKVKATRPVPSRARLRFRVPVTVSMVATVALAWFLITSPPAHGRQMWLWPVSGPVLTPYENDNSRPYAAGMHRGIDIGAPVGTPVVAAAAGEVQYAGPLGQSGTVVSVRTEGGLLVTTYLHLGSVAAKRGERVAAGERIGSVGTTGRRSHPDPHLHFGVHDGARPHTYYDPLAFLGAPPAKGVVPPPARAAPHRPASAVPRPVPQLAPVPGQVVQPVSTGPLVPAPKTSPVGVEDRPAMQIAQGVTRAEQFGVYGFASSSIGVPAARRAKTSKAEGAHSTDRFPAESSYGRAPVPLRGLGSSGAATPAGTAHREPAADWVRPVPIHAVQRSKPADYLTYIAAVALLLAVVGMPRRLVVNRMIVVTRGVATSCWAALFRAIAAAEGAVAGSLFVARRAVEITRQPQAPSETLAGPAQR